MALTDQNQQRRKKDNISKTYRFKKITSFYVCIVLFSLLNQNNNMVPLFGVKALNEAVVLSYIIRIVPLGC